MTLLMSIKHENMACLDNVHLQNNNMDKNHKKVNPVKTKATNNIIILKKLLLGRKRE